MAADAITPNPANETEGERAASNGSGGILRGRRHRIFFDQFRGESVELEAGGMCRLPKDARPFRYGKQVLEQELHYGLVYRRRV